MSNFPDFGMPEVLIGPEALAEATAVYADWTNLVARIRSGQTDGMEELYQLVGRGIRFYLASQIGPDEVEGRVHNTLVTVVQAIRRDELKDPERLMSFVRLVSAQAAAQETTESVVFSKLRQENPEVEVFHQVLAELSQRHREALKLFYLAGLTEDQICKLLALTPTLFSALTWAATTRCRQLLRSRAREIDPTLRTEAAETSAGLNPLLDVERVLPVVAHAFAVFGDEKKASHWLATPLPLLGDRSPSQLLEGQEGIELVEQVLTRIEHNIPS